MRDFSRLLARTALFFVLTLLTQIGGLAYLAGLVAARALPAAVSRWQRTGAVIIVSFVVYAVATSAMVPLLAKQFGRVRLPCAGMSDGPLVAASSLTCILNRGYVSAELLATLEAMGRDAAAKFPDTKITTLEGNLPFITGFPLLPHLSHRDGKKVDIAYLYRNASSGAAIPYGSPSRLGYFIYERIDPSEAPSCPGRWTPLRWDFNWAQPSSPKWVIDTERTAWMLKWLKDRANVSRLFIEPYLAQRMGEAGGKVRFQGCHAARHDDHIHIEIQ